jgi:MFS family permease
MKNPKDQRDPQDPNDPGDKASLLRRLFIFIALINLAEGLGQVGGIINQPLVYFLKSNLGFAPDQVSKYLSFLIIPWIIKPLYGLVSDYVPIFGYHRRPYLIGANALAVGAFIFMTGLTGATPILVALFLTAFGMAASSTISEAVLVENGNRLGVAGKFLNQQWLWFNLASVAASLSGGWLADHLAPASAFHTAAVAAAILPAIVMFGSWFLVVEEKKAPLAIGRESFKLPDVLKSKTFWLTMLFLFVWNIVPSFGTPLYFRMTDELKFSQQFIGIISAVGSIGSVLGAFVYTYAAKRMKLAYLLYLSLAAGTIGQLSYLFFNNATLALVISALNGVFGMLALVSSLTVAAHASPQKSAGFAFALLMSVNNLSNQLASNIGASLYVHAFHSHIHPVIVIAGVGTALCALFVPMLKLGEQRGDHFRKVPPPSGFVKVSPRKPL